VLLLCWLTTSRFHSIHFLPSIGDDVDLSEPLTKCEHNFTDDDRTGQCPCFGIKCSPSREWEKAFDEASPDFLFRMQTLVSLNIPLSVNNDEQQHKKSENEKKSQTTLPSLSRFFTQERRKQNDDPFRPQHIMPIFVYPY
jgi:hypothetical protein